IVPLYVDLQGPVTLAANHAGFLAALARALQNAAQQERKLILPPLLRADLERDPFPCFDAWLDDVAQVLAQRTALLMLDEFEALEFALASGRLDEQSVLGMLRHMIQHRPWLKVLLAGSHTLDEVQRWSSYLINVQVIPISYLSEEETHQLVEHPVEDFVLRYTPEASTRVFTLTRGHPALVQLLCTTIIAAKNRQPLARRRLADIADILSVIPETLQRGSLFFADIERNQIAERERAVLQTLAQQGEAAVVPAAALASEKSDGLEQALAQLLHRDLIEAVAGGYRFQVELIRQWFCESQPLPVHTPSVGR
ncbi:MAG TPA: ATP-binding protein, partial [Anaerolineae bacterium]|nr:ATP-binding protein [Anaerolineae bacterium]